MSEKSRQEDHGISETIKGMSLGFLCMGIYAYIRLEINHFAFLRYLGVRYHLFIRGKNNCCHRIFYAEAPLHACTECIYLVNMVINWSM